MRLTVILVCLVVAMVLTPGTDMPTPMKWILEAVCIAGVTEALRMEAKERHDEHFIYRSHNS